MASLRNLSSLLLGGNSLENASASKLHDFVKSNGGHTVITKVNAFISLRTFISTALSRSSLPTLVFF